MSSTAHFPNLRSRRLRANPNIRRLVRETCLSIDDLVLPLFVKAQIETPIAIQSMPGCVQHTLDSLVEEVKQAQNLNIPAVLLFGIPAQKDADGSDALSDQGIVQQALRRLKTETPNVLLIADLCFCEYTDHGHCGMLSQDGACIDNDSTLTQLAKQAISLAKAGADIIAPSGMMDGVVGAVRQALDQAGFTHISILGYSIKYASCFYSPFRDAAEGSPQFGDRKTYQMDPSNATEALKEAAQDIAEGADLLMVKPGLPYLDIIHRIKTTYPSYPLATYQVSGEYAMIKTAAHAGLINETDAMLESLTALKRAGADILITYFAKDLAMHLRSAYPTHPTHD